MTNRKTIPQADLYAVALSGGRDSAAAGIWALHHLPHSRLRFVFCDTQAELPEVYRYLDRYEVQHPRHNIINLRHPQPLPLRRLCFRCSSLPSCCCSRWP